MLKRVLYGGGAASALAAAYLMGSLTLGGVFAAPATPTQATGTAVTATASPAPPKAPVTSAAQSGQTTSESTATATTGAKEQDNGAADTGKQEQQPSYRGSITVPDNQEYASDAQEAKALQSKAKITADQAKSAALGKFSGATINKVELENENGSLVYSVELTDTAHKSQDVKVDAGNAKILSVEADGPEGNEATTGPDGKEAPETTAPAKGA